MTGMLSRQRSTWLPGAVLCVLLLSSTGCTYPAISHHEIDYDGTVERIDGTFRMDGQVEVDIGTAPPQNFSDVAVVLYDRDRTELEAVSLGPIATDASVSPKTRQVNITHDTPPAFIVVESPDFWQGNLQTIAFHRTDDGYERYFIGSEDEKFSPVNDGETL